MTEDSHDARTEPVKASFTPDEARTIDLVRGTIPRATWVRDAAVLRAQELLRERERERGAE